MNKQEIEAQAISNIKIFTIETGRRIREARQSLGISLRELSRQLKISISTISELEKGNTVPSLYMLFKITLALGITDLFGKYNHSVNQKVDIIGTLGKIGLNHTDTQQVLKYIKFLEYENKDKRKQYTLHEQTASSIIKV